MNIKTITIDPITRLEGHGKITIFLNEAENIKSEKFNVSEQLHLFIESEREVLACENCLRARQRESGAYPISTMKDLLKLVEESDKLLTFG